MNSNYLMTLMTFLADRVRILRAIPLSVALLGLGGTSCNPRVDASADIATDRNEVCSRLGEETYCFPKKDVLSVNPNDQIFGFGIAMPVKGKAIEKCVDTLTRLESDLYQEPHIQVTLLALQRGRSPDEALRSLLYSKVGHYPNIDFNNVDKTTCLMDKREWSKTPQDTCVEPFERYPVINVCKRQDMIVPTCSDTMLIDGVTVAAVYPSVCAPYRTGIRKQVRMYFNIGRGK